MLKNKRNREKIQQRQHLKDRDHHTGTVPPNSDIHVLQHTVNIDAMPDQLPWIAAARGMHGNLGQQGAPHGSHYNQQKESPYQQNVTASVQATGSGDQQRHQRHLQQRPHEVVASTGTSQPSNILQQPSIHGRISSGSNAPGRGSNLSVSGVLQTPNGGGSQEGSRSSHERRGHQKPHRPGK